MKPNVQPRFASAHNHVVAASMDLMRLRHTYETGDHPDRKARMRALTAKIDTLDALANGLNPFAHPWVGDWKEP